MSFDFFNSTEHLEPHCQKCGTKIDYGITTSFDDEIEAHRCNECKEIIK